MVEKNTKVLIVSPSPEWGGASTANISIAKLLSDSGFDVTYNDEFYSEDSYNGFPVSHYHIHGKEKGANGNLEKLVHDYNYTTIIWGNVWVLRKYFRVVSKFHEEGINQIAIFHSLSLGTSFVSRMLELVCAQLMRYMNHIVYVSAFTEKSWEKYRIISKHPEKGIVIHNPMEYNGLPHIKKNQITVGFVGRFSQEKQPEVFCSLSENSSYNFVAFGNGPLLDGLKAKYSGVSFMGNCMDTDTIYSVIDILVMTSKFENCPMVILESKARGIPCVVPNVGGISEIVTNGYDGIIFKEFNKKEILNSVDKICGDYEVYSRNCILRAEQFKSKSLVDKWKSIL